MKRSLIACSLLFLVVLSACASKEFRSLTSKVLTSTGYVSGSQVRALFSAGDNLVDAASPLTEEQEYYLGRAVAASILGQYKALENQKVQRYVSLVGRSVSGLSDRPDTFSGYHFLVLDTDEINAMAAPAGFIFVSRGLLEELQSEDELAAVLSHEVGHVVLHHGIDAISGSKVTDALQIIGTEAAREYRHDVYSKAVDLFSDSVQDVTETLINRGYSRSQEYAADEYAQLLLSRTNYDQGGLKHVLSHLERLSGAQGGWFKTHPDPEDRLDALEIESTRVGVSVGEEARMKRFRIMQKQLQ